VHITEERDVGWVPCHGTCFSIPLPDVQPEGAAQQWIKGIQQISAGILDPKTPCIYDAARYDGGHKIGLTTLGDLHKRFAEAQVRNPSAGPRPIINMGHRGGCAGGFP
jgi:hypothetical protein